VERIRAESTAHRAKFGSLCLVPNANLAAAPRKDYAGMREMIIGDAPKFDETLTTIKAFETEINS